MGAGQAEETGTGIGATRAIAGAEATISCCGCDSMTACPPTS
jgi:hypothetical protein